MTAPIFVDTNILLYTLSTVQSDASKSRQASAILHRNDLALSVQVLQEFYAQATRPSAPDRVAHEDAVAMIESWTRFRVQANDLALVRAALAASHRYQISYWDAAIIEGARRSGCKVLLSEDLDHGRDYDGVRLINPFIEDDIRIWLK